MSNKLFDTFQDISSNEIVQQRSKRDQSDTIYRALRAKQILQTLREGKGKNNL